MPTVKLSEKGRALLLRLLGEETLRAYQIKSGVLRPLREKGLVSRDSVGLDGAGSSDLVYLTDTGRALAKKLAEEDPDAKAIH